jgi:hypothetical protein
MWSTLPSAGYKTTPSDPDLLSYYNAMSDAPHVDKWMRAAAIEIDSLEKNETWIETKTENAKTCILPGTWVYKRKRTPDGEQW